MVNYKPSGTSLDWAFGEADIKHSITMELRPGRFDYKNVSEGFFLPAAEIIPAGQEVWAFHETVIRELIKSGKF